MTRAVVEMPRLLLVEDRDLVRAINTELDEAMGWEVEAASSAEAALACWSTTPRAFDAVVTDLDLPGLDGLELVDRLRGLRPGLPALVLSGRGDDPRLAVRQRRGDIEYLTKPVAAAQLERALGRLLSPARAPARRSAGRPPSSPVAVRRWPRYVPLLTAAGVAITVALVVAPTVPRPPELPPLPTSSITRGHEVLAIRPRGELSTPPTELSWRPVQAATRYQAMLETATEIQLFSATSVQPSVSIPASVRATLASRVTYFWHVAALDADGSVVAWSPRTRFVIVP